MLSERYLFYKSRLWRKILCNDPHQDILRTDKFKCKLLKPIYSSTLILKNNTSLISFTYLLFLFYTLGPRKQWKLVNKRLTWEFPVVYYQLSLLLSLLAVQASFVLPLKLSLLAKPLQPCTKQLTVRQVIWISLLKKKYMHRINRYIKKHYLLWILWNDRRQRWPKHPVSKCFDKCIWTCISNKHHKILLLASRKTTT